MTLSTPLLAAAPLLAGLIGPALIGAAPAAQQADRPAVAPAQAPAQTGGRPTGHAPGRGAPYEAAPRDIGRPGAASTAPPVV
ncbi:hypothetical protein, partial [Nonomuraea fuscirosea]|uniref:hypothetical protein n=1 Tax=Nonomuraea fuscirosea TaxID=1291556 RepID=UPI00340D4A55